MQTFIPSTSFRMCAQILDYRRLGKQRVECLQILQALAGQSKGWINHPATQQWKGCEVALIHYGLVMCDEWVYRKYKDTCFDKIAAFFDVFGQDLVMPSWWGDDSIHRSHRSRLVEKAESHYKPIFDRMCLDYVMGEGYIWPSRSN